MSKNQLREKVNKLQKKVDDREIIRTYAQLFSWESDNDGSMRKPRIAKPLLDQLHKAGLYTDLK